MTEQQLLDCRGKGGAMLDTSSISTSRFALVVVVLCASIAFILPSQTFAGTNTWTQAGPEGGSLCALAMAPADPDRVYAVVGSPFAGEYEAAGLFRSADGGTTWEPTGTPVGPFSCLVSVDAIDPLRVYSVGIPGARRSIDGGSTWEVMVAEGSGLARYPIAVTRADANFLMFADGSQLMRSRDRGDTWQQSWPSPSVALQSIAMHPSEGGRVFAVTRLQGVFVSDDYGDTWSPASGGLPADLELETLVFDPNDPTRQFLLARSGIYRSLNGGAAWSLILPAEEGVFLRLVVRSDSALFAQLNSAGRSFLVRSLDGGETWLDLGSPFPLYPEVWLPDLVAAPGRLLGASSSGVMKSEDSGQSWHSSNSGLRATSLFSFALDRENPERLYGIAAQPQNPSGHTAES